VRISPDDRWLSVVGSEGDPVRLFSIARRKQYAVLGLPRPGPGEPPFRGGWLVFSPDARMAMTDEPRGRLALWETATGRLRAILAGYGDLGGVTFGVNGRALVWVHRRAVGQLREHAPPKYWVVEVKLMELATGRVRTVLRSRSQDTRYPVVLTGDVIARAEPDGRISVWHVERLLKLK
jgi:hypothetical protein